MSTPEVRLEIEDHIGWIVLANPANMNVLSAQLLEALGEKIRCVAADPTIRCVVLTGEGRAFSAGGDLAGFKSDIDSGQYENFLARLVYAQEIFNLVANLSVPVIGAVNGYAIAGGLELLLCCDIIYAAESAKIGDGHAKYGIIPGGGSSVRLPRFVPAGVASEMLLSGELFSASQLGRWGLVNRVVPDTQLVDTVRELARNLAQRSPRGLAAMKGLLRSNLGRPCEQGLQAEIDAFADYMKSEDFKEGLAAFAEKRSPVFKP